MAVDDRAARSPTLPNASAPPLTPPRSSLGELVAAFVLVAVAGVSVLSWGNLDRIYASGDLFPYTELDPTRWLPAAMKVWTSDLTVGGNLNYESGYLLSSIFEWLPRMLGISAAITQRGEFAVVIAGTLLLAYALPVELGITATILPRLLGAFAYVFSLALIFHTGDLLVATVFLTVVLLPVLYGRFLRANGWRAVALGACLVLASQLVAYVYINPPQAMVVLVQVVLVCLYLLLQYSPNGLTILKTGVLLITTLAASAWWIVPAYTATFNSSVHLIAVTSVADWAWTHARSSLLNTWRFIPNWGWPYREYYPYNIYYNPRIMQVFQLWPIFVVNLALVATRRKTGLVMGHVLLVASAAIVAAFLIKGIHPPLTAANLLLYDHVPGFFLFREPTTKFAEPLAMAVSLLLIWCLARAECAHWHRRILRPISLIATMLVLGVLAWPAFSGMVAMAPPQDAVALDAGPMVKIPSYWYEMATYINGLPADGGVALLPNDDYYAQQYAWGFYGTDQIAGSLIHRPVLYLYDTPQSYASASTARDALVEQLVAGLHKGDTAQLARQLGLFGVRYVLFRRDITSVDIPGRHAIPPAQLTALLARAPDLRLVRTVGALDLYEVGASLVHAQVFAVNASKTVVSTAPTLDTLTAASASNSTLVSTPAPSCAGTAEFGVAPSVRVLGQDWAGYSVEVTTSQAPVLLVLNQSFNPGWQLTTPSGERAGACSAPLHVAVNGYANGWWITAPGTTTLHIAFAPQRLPNLALLISGAVLAASVLLLATLGFVKGLAYTKSVNRHSQRFTSILRVGRKTDSNWKHP